VLPPHEQRRLDYVRDLLKGASDKELDLLKYLVNHGAIFYEDLYRISFQIDS